MPRFFQVGHSLYGNAPCIPLISAFLQYDTLYGKDIIRHRHYGSGQLSCRTLAFVYYFVCDKFLSAGKESQRLAYCLPPRQRDEYHHQIGHQGHPHAETEDLRRGEMAPLVDHQ